MLRRWFRRSLILLLLVGGNAFAGSTQYLISGTGSGSLAGMAFDNQAFIISLIGDPAANPLLIEPLDSAAVSIAGLGTMTLTLSTALGYSDGAVYGSDVSSAIFLTRSYSHLDMFDFMLPSAGPANLTGPIAPVTSTLVYGLEQFKDIGTSKGLLTFNASSNVVFQAAAIPEPESLALMTIGLAVVAAVIRRRKRTTA